ncbi:MAG: MATE family efflux transporter [Oscillospiraceae bacterium]|nr:MATE family efflux transporter [Oscillospiraceae bacterium]
MRIQLSDHFTYSKLIRFTLPSIGMMIFTSIYSIVDGFFVSNFVGKTSFAAVNFIFPFLMVLGALGSMIGTGGSALIAKTLGEGKKEKANELFSMFTIIATLVSAVVAIAAFIFIRPIAVLLGAEAQMLDDCVHYGRILLISMPAMLLQFQFQSFFITAEKPQLGLAVTVIAGVTNMVLDALLVAVIPLGLTGAAIATAMSQLVGGLVPIIYFIRPNSSILRFTKPKFDGKALVRACTNGFSEFMSSITMSFVSMLFNLQLMKYAGEDGVAAYGVVMYVNMIFMSAFIGYATGTAPVVGFHYGAQNHDELKSLLKKSLVIIGIVSLAMLAAAELLARPLSLLFVSYDEALLALTLRAFIIFSVSFLFCGVGIYASAFFTALNDGFVSAAISFLRSVVFQIAAVIIFPLLWGIDGIWVSVVFAELAGMLVGIVFWIVKRKKYQYW